MAEAVFRLMTEPEIGTWYASDFAEAFAENERKPLPDILALAAEGRYQLWGLFDDRGMVGYAALWLRQGVPLVLMTHETSSQAMRNALQRAMDAGLLREPAVYFRVLGAQQGI